MFSALIGWMLCYVTGIAVPLGYGFPQAASSYDSVLAFERHWAGAGFTFFVITLFLWHAAHRIFHSLHDIGVHSKAGSAFVCYGIALMGTFAAAALLFAL
jgi:fumarate reductase subunit D